MAGEKVMVLKKTFFYDFRGLLIVRGGGFSCCGGGNSNVSDNALLVV